MARLDASSLTVGAIDARLFFFSPPPATLCAMSDPLDRRQFLKRGACAVFLFSLGLKACGDEASSDAEDLDTGIPDAEPDASAPIEPYRISGRPNPPAAEDPRIPVLWVEAGVCTGCASALLDSTEPGLEDLLGAVRLDFQGTLDEDSGAVAFDRIAAIQAAHAGGYLLVVDGSVPAGDGAFSTVVAIDAEGRDVTAFELIHRLSADAKAVVLLGTCASFGGIPSAAPNPGGYGPATAALVPGVPRVRVPGCPPHAAWIAGTLADLAASGPEGLDLDGFERPRRFFSRTNHDDCPRRPYYDQGIFASAPGEPEGCLLSVGCRGPFARGDCVLHSWNGQTSCLGVGHPCQACTSPGFPDARDDGGFEGRYAASPFYERVNLKDDDR